MNLFFATNNPGKFREIKNFFKKTNIKGLQFKTNLYEIQTSNLKDVIIYKLQQLKTVFQDSQSAIFVEDSGLFIKSLNGFPGVYSSYVYKTLGVDGVLSLMKNKQNRESYFECWIGWLFKNEEHYISAKCFGSISIEPHGAEGFGFDPIFIPKGYKRTFAQLSIDEKERISHRGLALKKLYKMVPRATKYEIRNTRYEIRNTKRGTRNVERRILTPKP